MGCQSSKASVATPVPHTPPKTLLEGSEAGKVADNASLPVISSGETMPASLTIEHPEAQPPLPPPNDDHTATAGPAEPASCPLAAGMQAHVQASSAHADDAHGHGASHGLLRKHHTLVTSKNILDVMVVEFSSHDSTVGSVLGRNCKEMHWKVMYDRDADPIDIKLNVQENKLHSNEIEIECNGQHLFCGAGNHAKAKLTEDFRYQWPFRGGINGINEHNFFEVRHAHFSGLPDETWYPATITGQRDDGFFEVTAQETLQSGLITEVKYPAVHKDNLREAVSKKPLNVPENCLLLDVPKQDPLRATLSLANGELVTHHFGRPSPPRAAVQQKSEISVKVSKDRSTLIASEGHQVISHLVSGEVQAKASEAERLRHSWTVQVGPFAEHTVEITKKHTLGKIVTLLVDGEVLAEATAADVGCTGNEWQCKFRFVGERVLDFEVYKTNAEGGTLDEIGHVKERRRYVHEGFVTISNDWDFSTARFFIDGVPFTGLPSETQRIEEPNLTTSPVALLHTYGISTPYLVDQKAPSNMMMVATKVLVKANESRKTAGGFFARCCDCTTVDNNDAIQTSSAPN